MTSSDVRDVLNLPSAHAGPRPSKKQKTAAPRPNLKGLAREVQYLGGDNPIAIVPEISFFKKRRLANKPAAKWELKPFANSARGDGGALVLRHWRRKNADGDAMLVDSEPQPEDGNKENQETLGKFEDSAFSKYNVKVDVPQYTEAQYNNNLESNDWTKEETDYLLDLAREYDLRWALIWDRYDFALKGPEGEVSTGTSAAVIPAPKPRTMEDLKARYYGVAARMMIAQTPAQHMNRQEFELYETMLHFNPAQERTRKEFALSTMARSKEEAREEESLLVEVRRLLARSQRFNEERRDLYNRLDYPHTETDINAFKSSNGLNTLLQNLMNIDKSKKRKSLVGPETAAAAAMGAAVAPGSAVSEGHNRRESIAASVGHRDSVVGTPATPAEPTPTSKKKGAQPPERRKLTELEEKTYGVSHHDRLGSGPTFRYEKINKLYSHKSGQQQLRMTNALSELDVPSRLAMPTAAVVAQFEVLWAAVANLVDLRKTSDKLEAEIKVEEARKAIRVEKQPAAEKPEVGRATGTDKGPEAAAHTGESKAEASEKDPAEEKTQAGGADGSEMQPPPAADGEMPAPSPVAIKEEEGEKDKGVRPGSSGAHKRSASVLSVTSDKSAKRQKK